MALLLPLVRFHICNGKPTVNLKTGLPLLPQSLCCNWSVGLKRPKDLDQLKYDVGELKDLLGCLADRPLFSLFRDRICWWDGFEAWYLERLEWWLKSREQTARPQAGSFLHCHCLPTLMEVDKGPF